MANGDSVSAGNCSNAFTGLVERFLGVSSLQGIASTLLGDVQKSCTSGSCPRVDISSDCKEQSINDVNCDMKGIFSTNVKLGTDEICDAGCSDVPCTVGCKGLDKGICYSSDWILCKAGCLGIHSCVSKCEHAIVDPCVDKLVNDCNKECTSTMDKCKAACTSKLTLQISGDFERLQNIVTSMSVPTLDVNCSTLVLFGSSPLYFQAKAVVHISNVALSLKIHTLDAGISTTNSIDLQNVEATAVVPFSGVTDCFPSGHSINTTLEQISVTDFNLDVDLKLDSTLDTIASVVCADLPFCKDAIKKEITSTAKDEIVKEVPRQVTSQLTPVFQKMLNIMHCPKLDMVV